MFIGAQRTSRPCGDRRRGTRRLCGDVIAPSASTGMPCQLGSESPESSPAAITIVEGAPGIDQTEHALPLSRTPTFPARCARRALLFTCAYAHESCGF